MFYIGGTAAYAQSHVRSAYREIPSALSSAASQGADIHRATGKTVDTRPF